MKDKKIIAYKTERTKNIAYALRWLIARAVMKEWGRLRDKQKNKSTLEYVRIENERSDLFGTLQASICECSCCRQADRDMFYNASLKEWFCTQCVQEYHEYYCKEKAIYGELADNREFYETFL